MERSNKNRVVTAVFIVEDDFDAQDLEKSIYELASNYSMLYLDTDKVQDHHYDVADQIGVFGD